MYELIERGLLAQVSMPTQSPLCCKAWLQAPGETNLPGLLKWTCVPPVQLLAAHLTSFAPLPLQEWFSKKYGSFSKHVTFCVIRTALVLTATVVAVAVPGELASLCQPQQTSEDWVGLAITSVPEATSSGC